jgi:serine protease Do
MSEFEHQNMNQNLNQYNRRDQNGIIGPNPVGKVPEYNFWAEQMQGGAYSSYNPNTNSWEYGVDATDRNGKKNKKQGTGKKTLLFILKGLCFGVIAAASFVFFQQAYYYINPEAVNENSISNGDDSGFTLPTKQYKLEVTKPGVAKVQLKSVISDVVNDTMPAIVSISSISSQPDIWFGQEYSQPMESSGSGIIVGKDEKELLIATNNHVVEGTEDITVTFIDGTVATAVIKGTDATADLAVITVDISGLKKATLDTIEVAKLGNSDAAKVGEMSIAIGNALGYGQSVTVGYISAKDREVEVSDGYQSQNMVLLQTDAAINPGNSGGALLNVNGEVIGINTVKYASNEVEGMGYAIPITRATPIINELMNRELLKEDEQGFLGIACTDVTEDVSEALNMPIGVYVSSVVEDSGSAKAGLIKGDIITHVNDIEITSSTQLREYVNSLRIGTEVKITFMRSTEGSYKENTASVILAGNPELKDNVE